MAHKAQNLSHMTLSEKFAMGFLFACLVKTKFQGAQASLELSV